MRYDQWWECKFIAEGIIDQGEAMIAVGSNGYPFRVLAPSGITS